MIIQRHRILLIEDSDFDRVLISREFTKQDAQAEVTCMSSIKNALADFDASDFDAVVTDINLPDGSGLDVIVYIRSREQDLPILALTGVGSEEIAVQAIKFGANDYLSKSNETFRKLPTLIADMISRRVAAASRDKTLAELRTLQDRFRDFAEAASDLFWETDSEHRLRFVSGSVESVLGADPSAFAGMFLPKLAAGHKVAARMGDAMSDKGAFRDVEFAYDRPGSGEVSFIAADRGVASGSPTIIGAGADGCSGRPAMLTWPTMSRSLFPSADRPLADTIAPCDRPPSS